MFIVQMNGPNDFVELRPSTIVAGGMKHPWQITTVWSDEQLREIGVFRVEPAMPSEGQIITEYHFELQGSKVVQVIDETRPIEVEFPIISDRQFYQAIAMKGLISKDEALAAVQTGTIPQALAVFLAEIKDPDEHFAAQMLLSGATQFERHHPLVDKFGHEAGLTDVELDDLWRLAASL